MGPSGTSESAAQVIVGYTITHSSSPDSPLNLPIVTTRLEDSEGQVSSYVMPANLAAIIGHELIKASRFANE